ncbi:four helix bundle protein [Patescibacteria group bacterium]|nr:four helix bundle protein [Patescibacteria group bacterium]
MVKSSTIPYFSFISLLRYLVISMGQFRSFEEMSVWQESRDLTRSVIEICKREKVKRDFAFIDQITRAARSISANIAEGCDAQTNAEFIQFLGYAKRSASEVRSHLYDGIDEAYISKEEFTQLADKTKKIGSMIAKLIHHLQSLPVSYKRTYKQNNEITK